MRTRLPRLALRSQLRIQQLNMILRLLEARTVRGAAQELALSQSAVTKALKEIEMLFGVPLFERDSRGMRPTIYCTPLEEFARETLLGLDRAVEAIRALLRGQEGRVRIGVNAGQPERILGDSLPAIRQAFPRLVIYLHSDTSPELLRRLELGELDFALLSPPRYLDRAQYSFLPLASDPLVTLVRPRHRFARQRLVLASELLEAAWVLPPAQEPAREAVGFALLASGTDQPPDLLEANSGPAALELAVALDLVTVAPRTLARAYIEREQLIEINPGYTLPSLRYGIMRIRRHELQPGSHGVLVSLLRAIRAARLQK